VTTPLHVTFAAGDCGAWRITGVSTIVGPTLPPATALCVLEGPDPAAPPNCAWSLRGVISNTRYTQRGEVDALTSRQEGLRRTQATHAALIPMRKTDAWWALAQDERRAIFEEQSHHIGIGLEYLPAVARRLHHSRELGEPFDFLTWFEFAPEHEAAFDAMLVRLRASPEWAYVDREIDIRLLRDPER
jgi:chlorite dismutase